MIAPYFKFKGHRIYLDQRRQKGSDGIPFRLVGTKRYEADERLFVHTFRYIGEMDKLLNFVVDYKDDVVSIYKEEYCTKDNKYKVYENYTIRVRH